MIFFETRSVLARYGLPATIFCEYASPMPGSVASCSVVAVFRSISSAGFAAAGFAAAGFAAAGLAGAVVGLLCACGAATTKRRQMVPRIRRFNSRMGGLLA